MGFFDKLKRTKSSESLREKINPECAFSFPHDDAGVKKVIDWIKNAKEIILENDAEGNLILRALGEKTYLYAYTDVSQRKGGWKKGERLAATNFAGLQSIFGANLQIDGLWLNPNSDSVQINRFVFSEKMLIKKETTVQIGHPAVVPTDLINILVSFAERTSYIEKIYLSLMHRDGEWSYAVVFNQTSNLDFHQLSTQIAPELHQLYDGKSQNTLYPVDFMDRNPAFEKEEYLIYQR